MGGESSRPDVFLNGPRPKGGQCRWCVSKAKMRKEKKKKIPKSQISKLDARARGRKEEYVVGNEAGTGRRRSREGERLGQWGLVKGEGGVSRDT